MHNSSDGMDEFIERAPKMSPNAEFLVASVRGLINNTLYFSDILNIISVLCNVISGYNLLT